MKSFRSSFRSVALALFACGIGVVQASALPVGFPQQQGVVVNVAADCYTVGQEVAAERGGTLAKASSATRAGQSVCVIVVLLPGKEGERPRRAEIVVPQS